MKRKKKSSLQNLALLSQVGIMMLVSILGSLLIGIWLDKKLGTGMIATIIALILGVGAAFRNLYVLGLQKSKEYENSESPETYVREFEKKIREDKADNEEE